MMGSSPWQLQRSAPTRDSADASIQRGCDAVDDDRCNDMLYQFDASRDYDPSADLDASPARLAINSADDVTTRRSWGLWTA